MAKIKEKDATKHIDTVFDTTTAKEIEEARDGGRYTTTSAWMRAAVEFVLKLRRKSGSDDFIVILNKEAKEIWRVPVEMCDFLTSDFSQEE